MKFDNLSLPQALRYGLTGLIAVILFFIIPLAVFNPDYLKFFESMGGITGAVIFGFVIGFLLDAMKVYQFSLGYGKRKKEFKEEISRVLGIEEKYFSAYFSKAFQLDIKNGGEISFSHSRWVLMNVASTLFNISSLLWLAISSLNYYETRIIPDVYLSIAFFSFLIGTRLTVTSKQEEIDTNTKYIVFCSEHKESLK